MYKPPKLPTKPFWCPVCQMGVYGTWKGDSKEGALIVCKDCESEISDFDDLERREFNPSRRYNERRTSIN